MRSLIAALERSHKFASQVIRMARSEMIGKSRLRARHDLVHLRLDCSGVHSQPRNFMDMRCTSRVSGATSANLLGCTGVDVIFRNLQLPRGPLCYPWALAMRRDDVGI